MWGSFRDHRGERIHNAGYPEIPSIGASVGPRVPVGESRVPSCLPHLSLISIFVDNKSICTGSGMSTWAHMDQRWFIQCVKEGRKGTTGPTEKKDPRAL